MGMRSREFIIAIGMKVWLKNTELINKMLLIIDKKSQEWIANGNFELKQLLYHMIRNLDTPLTRFCLTQHVIARNPTSTNELPYDSLLC